MTARYLIIAMALCFCGSLFASDSIVKQILNNNKEVNAAYSTMSANTLSAKSENNFADPEVEMAYLFSKPEKSIELSVTENIEWPAIYGARKKMIGYQISGFEYLYQTTLMEVALRANTAIADLVNVNRRILLQKKIVDDERNLVDLLQSKIGTEFSILEINKLKLELADREIMLNDLLVQKQAIINDLKVLNGGKDLVGYDNEIEEYMSGDLQTVDKYIADYKDYSPEYKVALQQQLADAQSVDVAKYSAFPNFTVGYKYKDEDGARAHGFIIGMSLPFFSSRHKKASSKATAYSSYLMSENSMIQAEYQIRQDYDNILAKENLINKYRPLIENNDYLSLLKKAFNAGQINLRDYIIEVRDLSDAKERLYTMEYDYNLLLLSLNKYEMFK